MSIGIILLIVLVILITILAICGVVAECLATSRGGIIYMNRGHVDCRYREEYRKERDADFNYIMGGGS